MGDFIRTWAGECSAWECDDLGHLNMRHYMTKVHQARQMIIIKLGLDEAFKHDAVSSVRVRDFHIKYLGEARPGDPLRIETAVLDLGETDIRLCHIMYHVGGRLAATIVENVEHISLHTNLAFPWPKRVISAADTVTLTAQPDPSKPRGFSYDDPVITPSMAELENWGVALIGAGVFRPDEMGLDERITPQGLLGRTTETIGHITSAWPEMHREDYRESGGSAALLEARIIIGAPAERGDGYHFYSGVKQADAYTRHLVHNMVNVVTGENVFSMTGIGCLFNLKTRKLTKTEPADIDYMMSVAIPEFSKI